MRVLVTGGSSDIGHSIILDRLEKGDEVLTTASNPESANRLNEKLYPFGDRFQSIQFHFSQIPQSLLALQKTHQERKIDAVVLNAFERVEKLDVLHEHTLDDLGFYLTENIMGNVAILHTLLPSMAEKAFGRLVLISSLSTLTGTGGYGAYCAAKGALEALFLNLAVDYGQKGILANIVRPGLIATERTKEFWSRPAYERRVKQMIPSGQLGTPGQIASGVSFFLTEDCYANGTTLNLSGGLPLVTSRGALG